ncbi:MAG: Acyl-coenzyme A:6-aminopenicillanic acid acyl-transferase [Planctomycetes bacterium ADurb.Bin126]|mgnify:CR=1 FL=1|nr:MAG: Acyl-coenzyme A:6-aminopenicillanic acid acyl-transferase [Planctomycetes bacterium ADurb.Bin126]HOD84178.1 C45 family autoproteolytic acyltransferase/hydrolase [Phycisphaerae bacterium]HQL73764.1 C45 family autoproteolytic acyltransferase/hydrolase [Phycisphaerae bacterium]
MSTATRTLRPGDWPCRTAALRTTTIALLTLLGLTTVAPPLRAGELYKPERLDAAGTPEQIGRAVGLKYGKVIRGLHPTFLNTVRLMRLSTKETIYKQAREMAAALDPADVAEMKALAQAGGIDYDDLLFLNLFYQFVSGPACRQIAVFGPASRDGHLLHARNLDWPDYPHHPLQRNNLILNVRPAGGIEYLALTYPGLTCVLTGTNRKGITVAFNQLRSDGHAHAGEPTFFTLKRVLRTCSTLAEAIDLIRRATPSGNGSVLISDAAARTAAVVEILGRETRVRAAKDGMISNANHATREAGWKDRMVGPADWPVTWAARKIARRFGPKDLQAVLACDEVLQRMNILSVVFDPTGNRMFLSCGPAPAAKADFVEYPLFQRDDPSGK